MGIQTRGGDTARRRDLDFRSRPVRDPAAGHRDRRVRIEQPHLARHVPALRIYGRTAQELDEGSRRGLKGKADDQILDDHRLAPLVRWVQLVSSTREMDSVACAPEELRSQGPAALVAHVEGDQLCHCAKTSCLGSLPNRVLFILSGVYALILVVTLLCYVAFFRYTPLVTLGAQPGALHGARSSARCTSCLESPSTSARSTLRSSRLAATCWTSTQGCGFALFGSPSGSRWIVSVSRSSAAATVPSRRRQVARTPSSTSPCTTPLL
ncbi:hypothetical protein DFJ74DRAFT_691212 [Hyaloraphidium curvatum]|nr:hypothetical protein DFJ74DRAFT_691212 [Hyaloraphidium curvatum]